MDRAYFLIPEFDAPNKIESLTLESGETIVGRKHFGINDKRCSRAQVKFQVDGGKTVKVTQLGVNICTLSSAANTATTVRNVPFEMGDGDKIGLIGDGFLLKLEVEKINSFAASPSKLKAVEEKSTPITTPEDTAALQQSTTTISTTTTTATTTAATTPSDETTAATSDKASKPLEFTDQVQRDELLAQLLQAEFDIEAEHLKGIISDAEYVCKLHLIEPVLTEQEKRDACLTTPIIKTTTKPKPTTTTTTKKRKHAAGFGLIKTRDGRRRTARRHTQVDYREANFAFEDTDDESIDETGGDDARFGYGSDTEDEWEPTRADSDDEDFTTGEAVELVDGVPKCMYGAACFRKNPDHIKEFWHPPK